MKQNQRKAAEAQTTGRLNARNRETDARDNRQRGVRSWRNLANRSRCHTAEVRGNIGYDRRNIYLRRSISLARFGIPTYAGRSRTSKETLIHRPCNGGGDPVFYDRGAAASATDVDGRNLAAISDIRPPGIKIAEESEITDIAYDRSTTKTETRTDGVKPPARGDDS